MKLSLCMIVKNEEENIVNCLDRALKIVDEAIVVDTGSTDKTMEILLDNYGNNEKVKIVEYEWEEDFSKARNKSLEYATGDWILVLDADERIFADRNVLEDFLTNNKAQAYRIPIYNIFDKSTFTVSASIIRLFKNNNPIYRGAIHEQVEIDGVLYGGEVLDENICKLYHYGYNSNVIREKNKAKRNMDIIKEEIKRNPKDPFNWYNKGVTEMIEGNYDTAIDDFIKAHELTNNIRRAYHNDLIIRMIQCMMLQKNYNQAAEFIEDISKDIYMSKMPDIYYYLGLCYVNLEKYDYAIDSFRKAIETGEYRDGISKYGVGSYLSMIEWANVLELKKEKKQAIEKYKEAVFNRNNINFLGLDNLKRLLREENMDDEIIELDKAIANINKREKPVNNSNDIEKVKKEFKDNIQLLIESNMLKEAKEIIEEYEKIVKNDIDMYSIKGVIAVMEGDMDRAEDILNKGLLEDSNNYDILYNIAYVYKMKGLNSKAVYFYKKLYHMEESNESKEEIEDNIKMLGGNIKRSVLIGSPVRQKPLILKEFLESLKELKKEDLDVYYYFVDDNKDEESSNLLFEFSKYEKNVIVHKAHNEDVYICDDITHNWKEQLIWKVADFKDSIIEHAKQKNFDYIFLIDSDLVLHPYTLKQLVSTGKDIISEIFWTKWQPNAPELPQVWMQDVYTQYNVSRGEALNQYEINKRHQEFISKLRIPGIYEVGGLGACTLISKYAMDKGVSFKEIKNLSFWGEDRHFCIRAAALGLSLYVDTNHPAYHIYREKDINGVQRYKLKNKAKNITLVNTNYSGSNSYAMFKLMPEHIKDKYFIEIMDQNNSNDFINAIVSSDVVVVTEGNYHFNKNIINKNQIVIDLWHGFPLKAMGYIDKGEVYKSQIDKVWNNVNYIGSYSELFNILMNKCINTDPDKYVVLGAPRNDLLFTSNGREILSGIIGKNLQNKNILFYMPTYRHAVRGNRNDGNKSWNNYFGFDSFDEKKFKKFLVDNDIELVLKLHPADEAAIINKLDISSNVSLVTNNMLRQNDVDLYEILNSCDLLITDYSSVYFDLLLLDKPMIFTPTDLKEYEDSRGFLLEPYDSWTPGPKCLNQESLEDEIIKSLRDKNYYKKERETIRNKVHYYKDGNSSERTWEFINSLLK